jgi:hypothetical protein
MEPTHTPNNALPITTQAKILAEEILDDIEIKKTSISSILMKTNRLARLLRDGDAQRWISFEINGYPKNFEATKLGKCSKYYTGFFGITMGDDPYVNFSAPALEDFINTTNIDQFTKFSSNKVDVVNWTIRLHAEAVTQFQSISFSIYRYVLEVYLSLEIGDIANDIFQDSRILVDKFVQDHCSHDIKEQFLSINDRLKENVTESYSQALLTVRRVLVSIADSIYPPNPEPYTDKKGKSHAVDNDNYVNRILAYIDKNIPGEISYSMIETDIEHLAARLEALNEKSCKGVHVKVTKHEAQLAIIQMYMIIAEIARLQNK